MKQKLLASLLAGLTLALAACSGGSGSGSSFSIISCSLGCSGAGVGGDGQVSCGIQDVFVNGQIRITFSSPVQESSLSVFSVQVIEFATGKTPPADRFVDSVDPRVLVFRPQLTFDSTGNPVFGLTGGASYTIKLPGVVEDPSGPYVTSASGAPNRHRMLCTVEASLGILDAKPGAPTIAVTVDTVDPVSGAFTFDVPADGAIDVFRNSLITMTFDDLMNPATLVNPVTGVSNSIQVLIDPDGDTSPSGLGDQQLLVGTFTISLDQDLLQTVVLFQSELGFPSAGSGSPKRKIVVRLPATIADLGGNPISNPGDVAFQPEIVLFPPTSIDEDFTLSQNEDISSSGALWGGGLGGLLPGPGGGSGRLGALLLDSGQVLVLNTDSEDFSSVTDPAIFNPASVIDAVFDGTTFTVPPVTDGIFEFSSLRLNSGSQLRFKGSKPARVFVRGQALVQGVLSVAADDSGTHPDSSVLGAVPLSPGPSGALGGDGGDLTTWVGFETIPGVVVPPPGTTPPILSDLNGQIGVGVEDNLLMPSGLFGGGQGGLAWPQTTPTDPGFHFPVSTTDLTGVIFDTIAICKTSMKGGVGSGGAFGLNGGLGTNLTIPGFFIVVPESPAVTPGSAADFGVGIGSDPDSPQRTLGPETGFLHGGAGGGGGGSHIARTATNGQIFSNCEIVFGGSPAQIIQYFQHSSPAGGSAGGALQLQAGRDMTVDGVIDAGGGQGGSRATGITTDVTAGGGGAGGAALLQSPTVQLAGLPGRVNVAGGDGGTGTGNSRGGTGGAGLLRLETLGAPLDVLTESVKVLPDVIGLTAVGATPGDIISTGLWNPVSVGPAGLNGAQSCWLRPAGNFFVLQFLDDDVPAIGDLGWDLTLLPNPASLGPQSYRGDNALFENPFEVIFGNDLGSAPLVVRFQGARSVKTIDDLCQVTLEGPNSEIFPGSLTGWVKHPKDLNDFFSDPSLRPNMIRYQVIYDTTQVAFGALLAVTDITISVLPD